MKMKMKTQNKIKGKMRKENKRERK